MPPRHTPIRARKPTFLYLPSIGQALIFMLIITPPILVLLPPRRPVIVYGLIINIITFLFYRHDKAQSRVAGWRVTERHLHLCELLGGWPAAFVAQKLFHHKTRKSSYQLEFWAIVIAHEAIWVDRLTGGVLRKVVTQ